MECRILEKGEFCVVGVKKRFSTINNAQMQAIPKTWQELSDSKTGSFNKILALSDAQPPEYMGVMTDMTDDAFDYWFCVETTKTAPKDFSTLVVPAATWAVFDSVGPMPTAIQNIWQNIFSDWLPNSGYEHAQAPEIEWYSSGDIKAEDFKSAVWIPVVKK